MYIMYQVQGKKRSVLALMKEIHEETNNNNNIMIIIINNDYANKEYEKIYILECAILG